MASRVGDIIIDCNEPELLAGFWCEVLGYRVFARDETGVAIRGATISPDILFIRVSEPKAAKIACTSMSAPPIAGRMRSWVGCSASAPNGRASSAPAPGWFWKIRRATSSA